MNREQIEAHLALVGGQPIYYGVYRGVLFPDGWFVSMSQLRFVDRSKRYYALEWGDLALGILMHVCHWKAEYDNP